MKFLWGVLLLAAGCAATEALALAAEPTDLDPGAQLPLAESHTVAKLDPTNSRRLFVLDTAFPAAEAAKTYVLDGSTGAIQGMFNQAYWPNFAVSPDGTELYAVDTYWEKHTRGKRSDYIVVRDARTLDVKEDIPLPAGRLLIVSKKYNFDVTPDGHYGLTYNLAPSTAVTVTDLKARKPVGSIPIPGCALIFAQAPNRFSSLCADGSIATVTFDESAKGSIQRADKVFDAKNDPAFEHSAWDKKHQMLYLVTYSGDVVPVSLAGEVGRSRRQMVPHHAGRARRGLAAGRLADQSLSFCESTALRAHASGSPVDSQELGHRGLGIRCGRRQAAAAGQAHRARADCGRVGR